MMNSLLGRWRNTYNYIAVTGRLTAKELLSWCSYIFKECFIFCKDAKKVVTAVLHAEGLLT